MNPFQSKASDAESKTKSSRRERRGLSRRVDSEEFFSDTFKWGSEQDRRSSRRHRSSSGTKKKKLKLIGPLNDLFAKAVDYRNCRLANRSARYGSSVVSIIHRTRKKLHVQMKTDPFSRQYSIAVIKLLARIRTVCSHKGVSEEASVWGFQFYLTGQAHALSQSRLAGNIMALDAGQLEMLETYPEEVKFLLRTHAPD